MSVQHLTALELVPKIPQFPQQIRVAGQSGKERLFSLHPTPLNQLPRFRIYNPRDHRVSYTPYATPEEISKLLRLGEPWTVVGYENWEATA
jgi:hypothetical protein